jgi:probable rRNA maturation factor
MSSGKQEQGIAVQITKNFSGLEVDLPRIKKLVKTVCNRFEPCKSAKTVVSIAIVDDAEMRRVNKQFLGHSSTTDCLSFNLSDDRSQAPERKGPKTQKKHALGPKQRTVGSSLNAKLFELVVNGEMAVREAKLRGHSSQAEAALYITHGLLHNLGFDDSTKLQAKKMHDTEDEILQQLGYGSVYNKSKKV